MIENNGQNAKQNIDIAEIKKDIQRIFEVLKEIKENHLHDINEEIKCLNLEIKNLKQDIVSRPTWFMTSIISLCLMLISFIVGFFVIK